MAAVVDVRSRVVLRRPDGGAWRSSTTDGSDPRIIFLEAVDDALVRRHEAVRRPHPLQGDGRLVDGIAREREMLRDLRADADIVLDTSDLNVHELQRQGARRRSRTGRSRAARDGDLVRLQVRPAGRRRPGGRLPVPAQPALGARAAAADRPRRSAVRDYVLAQPGADEFLDAYEQPARDHRGRLPARGQALRDHRRRLHRRQAPSVAIDRGAGRAGCTTTAWTSPSSTATWGASDRAGARRRQPDDVRTSSRSAAGTASPPRCQALRRVTAPAHRGRHRRRRRRVQRPAAPRAGRAAAGRPADGPGGAVRRRRLGPDLERGRAAPVPQRGRPARARRRQPADRRAVGAARRLGRAGSTGWAGCSGSRAGCCRCRSYPLDIEAGRRGPRTASGARSAARSRSRPPPAGCVSVALVPEPTRRPAPRPWRRCAPPTGSCSDRAPGSPACIPHLLVPELAAALQETSARRLRGAQPGAAAGRDRAASRRRPISRCWPRTHRAWRWTSCSPTRRRCPTASRSRRVAAAPRCATSSLRRWRRDGPPRPARPGAVRLGLTALFSSTSDRI